MLKDRTKDEMIGRLIKRQCNWTSSARPILHILVHVQLLVRVREGKYTIRFRRKNSQIQEKIATKKMAKATVKQRLIVA